ncbi:MAG: hypothetical protein ACLFR0_04480 [Alphaproteobacteria bacterium]
MNQSEKDSAKKYLLKNRTYKLTAYLFAFAGLFVFVALYLKFVDGQAMNFLTNPVLIIVLFAPFIPAIVLFFAAKKARRKAASVISSAGKDK